VDSILSPRDSRPPRQPSPDSALCPKSLRPQIRYYVVTVAPDVGQQWFSEEPVQDGGTSLDARAFVDCARYDGPPLILKTIQHGRRFPINFGPFDMPVVTVELGERLRTLAGGDVQLVPARIDGVDSVRILNVLTCCSCIDESRTIGTKWMPDDGRPDKVGNYRMIIKLFIDVERTGGSHVLRIHDWQTPLIISEYVSTHLTRQELEGVRLMPVT